MFSRKMRLSAGEETEPISKLQESGPDRRGKAVKRSSDCNRWLAGIDGLALCWATVTARAHPSGKDAVASWDDQRGDAIDPLLHALAVFVERALPFNRSRGRRSNHRLHRPIASPVDTAIISRVRE